MQNNDQYSPRWRAGQKALIFLVLVLGMGLPVACDGGSATPTPAPAETSIRVAPEFQPFYREVGGEQTLGRAITGVCEGPAGVTVQYFRNARLENDPAKAGVSVYPLGMWALDGVQDLTPAPVPESPQRTFPETGQTLQDEFLAFYEAHEGERWLGPPISPQLDEGELRVQYFRNGRLEWHPSASRERRVQVGALGDAHYAQGGANSLACNALPRPANPAGVGEVTVSASVKAPILYTGQQQVVYVEVETPAGQPVPDVAVVHDVSIAGQVVVDDKLLGRTDETGYVEGVLQLPEFEPGRDVRVTVHALDAGGRQLGTTSLAFKTWW